MKLHNNQLNLIRHLIRFNCLDYESCLKFLNTENEFDRVAMSYVFRPLTKNKYISKSKHGTVTVLKKGRALFPNEMPLISSGSDKQRIIQISKIAALMESCEIIITGELPASQEPHYVPSACWRNIAPGILSTTRFTGMLLAYGKKYAVYDIGDGSIEWQVRAESSLFYRKHSSYEAKADGMIFICDDDKRMEIAENIIRQTMWNRKALLNSNYTERTKPVRFSNAPIKLRTQYEHVYLTTPQRLDKDLHLIYKEDDIISTAFEGSIRTYDPKEGDLQSWPYRYYISPAFDLLKLVYFFAAVKSFLEIESKGLHVTDIMYALVMNKEDLFILNMYPDVLNSERVVLYDLGCNENA